MKLTGKEICALMRANGKTIAAVAAQWNLSKARIRRVRNNGVSGAAFVRDWLQICGVSAG